MSKIKGKKSAYKQSGPLGPLQNQSNIEFTEALVIIWWDTSAVSTLNRFYFSGGECLIYTLSVARLGAILLEFS